MKRPERQAESGFTLIELLISSTLMAVVAAGICSLLYLVNSVNFRVTNKTDNLNTARNAIERIAKNVRMGRNIGVRDPHST